MGLPVPEEIGMTARRLGPLNWRMEAWSWWIPDSMTLSLCLKNPSLEPGHRRELLANVARALRMCHDAGLVHPDLNSRNVLVMPTGDGWKVLVVDLDRASLGPPLRWRARARQMRRLYRSLAKEGVFSSGLTPEVFREMLREYLGADAVEAQIEGFLASCRRAVSWHRPFWKKPSA
jgi:serine/threonine protein kinase